MYHHRFTFRIEFEGEVLDVPEDMSVQEVRFALINLINGHLFVGEKDGESVIPFDPETLSVEVTPMIAKGE